MRALAIIVVAVVLIAIAAIALAPASLVAPAVAQFTSQHIALADVEGTLWNGRATIVGDDGSRLPFAWTTDRAALARGAIGLHLTPPAGATVPRGDITVVDGGLRARGVSLVVPASWLASMSTLPVTVAGNVSIGIDSFDWSPLASHGGAQFEWRDARLAAPGLPEIDLGIVAASLAANGNRFTGPVANTGGDVAVAGDLAASSDGGGEANLLLTPRRTDDAVARMLSALGTQEGGGYRLRARWRPR